MILRIVARAAFANQARSGTRWLRLAAGTASAPPRTTTTLVPTRFVPGAGPPRPGQGRRRPGPARPPLRASSAGSSCPLRLRGRGGRPSGGSGPIPARPRRTLHLNSWRSDRKVGPLFLPALLPPALAQTVKELMAAAVEEKGLSARDGVGGPDLRGQGELPSPCRVSSSESGRRASKSTRGSARQALPEWDPSREGPRIEPSGPTS